MTLGERVSEYLVRIAPNTASNRQIAESLGVRWPGSVYRVTRALALAGAIQRQLKGRHWVFSSGAPGPSSAEEAPPVTAPVAEVSGTRPPDTRAPEDWRDLWLRPLLSLPEGRAWFLEKLRCPCTAEQARSAEVWFRRRPLLDLVEQDYAACAGCVDAQEQLERTYNAVFALPDSCGVHKVWRPERPGGMRLPLPKRKNKWTPRLLRKHLARKRYLERALRALRIVRTRVDAVLLAGDEVVLVRCVHVGTITKRQLQRLRALGAALERRLGRRYFLASVVQRPEQLGFLDLAHVRWDEVGAWLSTNRAGTAIH